MHLAAPIAGRVVTRHAVPRQQVAEGDPLWTIEDWSTLWVRVSVFEETLPSVAAAEPLKLRTAASEEVFTARPLNLEPPATEGQRTFDIYYALQNPQGQFRPGQSVAASLPLSGDELRVLVPRSAILWDGFGTPWAYVRVGPETFARRRLELGFADQDAYTVHRGLEPGESVVTVGAETLRGEEFKTEIRAEDDD